MITMLVLGFFCLLGLTASKAVLPNIPKGIVPDSSMAGDIPMPTKTIAPGVEMPFVGMGTWLYNDTQAYESLCAGFKLGYTYVDTANGYGNQAGVGKAIKDCWKGTREELFVMTKIPGGLNHSETLAAHKQNLEQLGLDYVDHLMTHFPCDWDETPARCNKARRQEEWKALEAIQSLGKNGGARSIGVSHYCTRHLQDILEIATIKPAINQVEYHIGSGDVDDVIGFCAKNGITFQSFSPLCGPCKNTPHDNLITGDVVTAIGRKHGVSGAQVSLRFIVQQGLQEDSPIGPVIPKSSNPAHLQANKDLFGFELTEAEMAQLSAQKLPAPTPGDCSAK
jgi:diketogulonate reductase-like aldo/keto reductase